MAGMCSARWLQESSPSRGGMTVAALRAALDRADCLQQHCGCCRPASVVAPLLGTAAGG